MKDLKRKANSLSRDTERGRGGDHGSVTPGLPGHDWALPLSQGISGIGHDTVSEGVHKVKPCSGDFTVSWAPPGIPGREAGGGCARRAPQAPHVPDAEQYREPPRASNYARISLQ